MYNFSADFIWHFHRSQFKNILPRKEVKLIKIVLVVSEINENRGSENSTDPVRE